MVIIAQSVERPVVVRKVAGSNPVDHPIFIHPSQQGCIFIYKDIVNKAECRRYVNKAIDDFYVAIGGEDMRTALQVFHDFVSKGADIDKNADDETKLDAADFLHEALYLSNNHPDADDIEAKAQDIHSITHMDIDECRHKAMIMSSPSVRQEILTAIDNAYQKKLAKLRRNVESAERGGLDVSALQGFEKVKIFRLEKSKLESLIALGVGD